MPTGKVKWYDAEKGFGFLANDEGGDVFVHSSVLPSGVSTLKAGQRVDFGIVQGRRGEQALSLQLLDKPQSVTKATRRDPDDMVVIVEDLMNLLEGVSGSLRRGRYPESKESRKVAGVLRAVADQLDP